MIRTPMLALFAVFIGTSAAFAAGGTSGGATGAGRPHNQILGIPNMTQAEADANPAISGQTSSGGVFLLGASATSLGTSIANGNGDCGLYDTDCLLRDMLRSGQTSDGDRLGQERLSLGKWVDLSTGGVQRERIGQGIRNTGGNPADPQQRDNFLLALLRGIGNLGR